VTGGPADDTTRIKVGDDGQIQEAFVGFDVGNIRHPSGIWCCHIKLPIQRIVDHDRWFAAMLTRLAWLAFVANLSANARQTGQSSNAVWATGLALFDQIVMQFAVSVNLAAVFSRIREQFGLTGILTRTLT